jgi:hypothetical protein
MVQTVPLQLCNAMRDGVGTRRKRNLQLRLDLESNGSVSFDLSSGQHVVDGKIQA